MRYLSFALAAVLLAALLPLRAPAASGDDPAAAALLAKHHAYVGWQPGDGTFTNLRLTGKIVSAKGVTTYTFTQLREGIIYRTSYADARHPGISQDEGFTGNLFWASNQNGFTTPTFGDAAKLSLAEDIVFSESTSQLPGSSHGTATVDGKSLSIVRIQAPGGYAIDLYVDPDTGAYARAVIDPDGPRQETLNILGYTGLPGGKRTIGSFRYGTDGATFAIDKADANVGATDADLHPPAPRATWAFTNPAPFPMSVTDKVFAVDATVNGVPGHFIIDTGAFAIVLTKNFALRAHVKPFTTATVSGIGGKAQNEVDHIDTVTFGGNTLSNLIGVSGLDLGDLPYDGVIGFDLFGGAIVRINSDNAKMTIEDPSSATVDLGSGIALNVELDNSTPVVPMKMDGTIDVNATLDSGNDFYVLFSKDLVLHHGLKMLVDNSLGGVLQSHPITMGAGGLSIESCGHVDSLVLGPIVYQQPPACESTDFSGRDVLVGFDFLKHFNYIFDYPHGHLVMVPHKDQ